MPPKDISQTQEPRLEEDIQLPDIVRERYKGPSESMTALTRSTILGIPGFYIGKMIGNAGESMRPEKYVGLRSQTLSWGLAAAGVLLGFTSASREVNENKRQINKLKRTVEKIHDQNVALKQELKDQLNGRGTLSYFKDEWTQADPDTGTPLPTSALVQVKPETTVDAGQLQHEGAAKQQASQGVAHA